jgi:hypothetical protein
MIVLAEVGAGTGLGSSPLPFFIILSNFKVNAPVIISSRLHEVISQLFSRQEEMQGLKQSSRTAVACFISM